LCFSGILFVFFILSISICEYISIVSRQAMPVLANDATNAAMAPPMEQVEK
jgi:hypothetical protein